MIFLAEVPEYDGVVKAAGGELFAVWSVSDAYDPIGVFCECVCVCWLCSAHLLERVGCGAVESETHTGKDRVNFVKHKQFN